MLATEALSWNGFQYLLDKVSYGEWVIVKLNLAVIPEIEFDVADLRLERAKLIGIRRHISDHLRQISLGATPVKPLEDFGVTAAIQFVSYCLDRPLNDSEVIEVEATLRVEVKKLLIWFKRGDDLLLGASSGDFGVIGEYFVAILLRSWVLGRRLALRMSDKRRRRIIRDAGLPLALCRRIAATGNWPQPDFDRIIERQALELPTNNYFDLVKHPFIRLDGQIHAMMGSDSWASVIRAELIKGGVIGERYGKLWEDYCARILAKFGWCIVGRNINIRSGQNTITDIDILALKDGLLLVIQFKALGIAADTVYEHWLARSKITRGVEQAKLAADEMGRNVKLLLNLLAARGIKELPTQIQPLVVTTSELFTGWNPCDIPVTSMGSLISILRGASVKHTTSQGSVLSIEKFIKGAEADPAEFMELLRLPLDWRIAEEHEEVEYRSANTEFAHVIMPELLRKKRTRAKVNFRGVMIES
jgi:Holliday junction resolvase-like predicted endonuclease